MLTTRFCWIAWTDGVTQPTETRSWDRRPRKQRVGTEAVGTVEAMSRPKKGNGRVTPKKSAESPPADAPFLLPDGQPLMDPSAFEQAILDSTVEVDAAGNEPESDPIDMLMDMLTRGLELGPGEFLDHAAGAAWMIHHALPEGERAEAVGLYSNLDEVGVPLAGALEVLGMTEEVRSAATAIAALQRSQMPPWLRDLARSTVSVCAIGTYAPGDEVEVLVEADVPGHGPFVISAVRSRVVHELISGLVIEDRSIDSVIAELETAAEPESDDEMALSIVRVDPVDAANELALSVQPTIDWALDPAAGGLPFENDVASVLPLARWALSLLPDPTVEPFYGYEGEQREEALTRYEQEVGALDDPERELLGRALDFSVEQDPFRWTPMRIVLMFERAAAVIDDPPAFIDALEPFLRFSAEVRNEPDQLAHNLTVLAQVRARADELFG